MWSIRKELLLESLYLGVRESALESLSSGSNDQEGLTYTRGDIAGNVRVLLGLQHHRCSRGSAFLSYWKALEP